MRPPYLYLANLQDWPQEPDIIFDIRIEILALTNLYLNICEGIPECDLTTCTWLASRISLHWPQLPDIIFDVRIEILTLTNLHLDIYEGISKCVLPIFTMLASRISLQRPPGRFKLALIWLL